MFQPGKELTLARPRIEPAEGSSGDRAAWIARATISQRGTGEKTEIRFRFANIPRVEPPLALEAMVPLAIVPAMRLGCPLRIEDGIDRRLLEGAAHFQEIFTAWYPEFHRIPILARARPGAPAAGDRRGVGVFFSGGLDSLYTLVKHRTEITHAIFVHGCDIPLDDEGARWRASARLRETADSFGVTLVEVETDVTGFSDRFCDWGLHYHGCAFAAIAMLLSGTLRRAYLAASYPYQLIVPWGSAYVTDPLWSSPWMEFVHDGSEVNRLGKTKAVIEDPVALRHLRVCLNNPPDGYNCGQCEKCYRTMVGLRACEALERCPVFDRPLDLAKMLESPEVLEASLRLTSWKSFHDEAVRRGKDAELVAALDELFRRGRAYRVARQLAGAKHEITTSPEWTRSLPKFRLAMLRSIETSDPDWLDERLLRRLPRIREQVVARLRDQDPRWFRRQCRPAWLARLLTAFRRADR